MPSFAELSASLDSLRESGREHNTDETEADGPGHVVGRFWLGAVPRRSNRSRTGVTMINITKFSENRDLRNGTVVECRCYFLVCLFVF